MTDSLTELRLDALLQRLSSRAPTPGGGSAAALAGATGAALLHMVLELSGTSADGDGDADDGATVAELRAAAASWQSELLKLVDVDAAAYESVVSARRLPRETDREREARRVHITTATREATRAPLDIARCASAVLGLAVRVAAIGNRTAVSDVGVAALLAEAAVRGAILNVRINLPALPPDDPLRGEVDDVLARLLPDIEARASAVRDAVEERLG